MDPPVVWDKHGHMKWDCVACGIKTGWYREDFVGDHNRLFHQRARLDRGGHGGRGGGNNFRGEGGAPHARGQNVGRGGQRGGGQRGGGGGGVGNFRDEGAAPHARGQNAGRGRQRGGGARGGGQGRRGRHWP